jgi:hypothetical protein
VGITYETYASRQTRSCGNYLWKLCEPADKNLWDVLTKVMRENRQYGLEGCRAEHFLEQNFCSVSQLIHNSLFQFHFPNTRPVISIFLFTRTSSKGFVFFRFPNQNFVPIFSPVRATCQSILSNSIQ